MTSVVSPKLVPENDLIIDVRSEDEFSRGHIPGSQNIPLEILASKIHEIKTKEGSIYLSCQSGRRAEMARQQLEHKGITNILCIEGGYNGWKQSGLPTNADKRGISIMRQVQIIVGLMVLIGCAYQPLWFLTPLAGMGMLIAGLSNTCLMAIALGKMPWNKVEPTTANCCAH